MEEKKLMWNESRAFEEPLSQRCHRIHFLKAKQGHEQTNKTDIEDETDWEDFR